MKLDKKIPSEQPLDLSTTVRLDTTEQAIRFYQNIIDSAQRKINQLKLDAVDHTYEGNQPTTSWIVDIYDQKDIVRIGTITKTDKFLSYAPRPKAEAMIYLVAILNGLQPPRSRLEPLDTLIDQIRYE